TDVVRPPGNVQVAVLARPIWLFVRLVNKELGVDSDLVLVFLNEVVLECNLDLSRSRCRHPGQSYQGEKHVPSSTHDPSTVFFSRRHAVSRDSSNIHVLANQ